MASPLPYTTSHNAQFLLNYDFLWCHPWWCMLCCCCSITKACPTLCKPMDCSIQSIGKPCPSPSPEVCSDSCPLSWWFFLTISSPCFPLGLIGLISMLFKGLGRVFSWKHHNLKVSVFLQCSVFFMVQFSQLYMFSLVAQSCLTLCNPMNHSMPGLPVHHQLPESTQTHVHCVVDAIQPSHPLSSPPPPAPNLSQHQGLCKWVSSLHQVAKVLEFQLQHQSLQWTPRTDLL